LDQVRIRFAVAGDEQTCRQMDPYLPTDAFLPKIAAQELVLVEVAGQTIGYLLGQDLQPRPQGGAFGIVVRDSLPGPVEDVAHTLLKVLGGPSTAEDAAAEAVNGARIVVHEYH